ncbi:MAG: hypothetical protein Q9217_002673 [Psora testacea]
MTSNLSTTEAKSTETPSSKPCSTKILKDPHSIGEAMQEHGLWQNDTAAFERYPNFKKSIREILAPPRLSVMKTKQVEEFKKVQRDVERLNEDTVLQNLVPLIIKRKYTSEKDLQNEEQERYNTELTSAKDEAARMALKKRFVHTSKMWRDDGLLVTMTAEFKRTLLPNRYAESGFEAQLAKVLAKDQAMKNPTPDYCYGLSAKSFNIPPGVMITPELHAILGVAPGVIHPFLIIEGKADRGQLAEAQNQACRGGATLVNAARLFLERIGVTDVDSADERTVVFSATMSPAIMEISIHWAEITKDGVRYHMNELVTRVFREDDQLVDLRRMLHNIINWGCNTRRKDLDTFHRKLHEFQIQETLKELEAANGKMNKKRKLVGGTPTSEESASAN